MIFKTDCENYDYTNDTCMLTEQPCINPRDCGDFKEEEIQD